MKHSSQIVLRSFRIRGLKPHFQKNGDVVIWGNWIPWRYTVQDFYRRVAQDLERGTPWKKRMKSVGNRINRRRTAQLIQAGKFDSIPDSNHPVYREDPWSYT